jgi:hypothetical protein
VALHSSSPSHSVFRLVPRYTFRSEGDKVCDDDPIVLLAADSGYGEQYLHASKAGDSYEVNLSKVPCGNLRFVCVSLFDCTENVRHICVHLCSMAATYVSYI